MSIQKFLLFAIAILISAIGLMSCTFATESGELTDGDDVALAIQGTWFFQEEVDENFYASYRYTFEDGAVCFSGYPPIEWVGQYRVKQTAVNELSLTLFELQDEYGEKLEERQLTLQLDTEQDTLLINGKGPFSQ